MTCASRAISASWCFEQRCAISQLDQSGGDSSRCRIIAADRSEAMLWSSSRGLTASSGCRADRWLKASQPGQQNCHEPRLELTLGQGSYRGDLYRQRLPGARAIFNKHDVATRPRASVLNVIDRLHPWRFGCAFVESSRLGLLDQMGNKTGSGTCRDLSDR